MKSTKKGKTTKKRTSSKGNKKKKAVDNHGITGQIGTFFKLLLLMLLLGMVCFMAYFYFQYGERILDMQKEAKKLVWSSNLDTFKDSQTSLFFDSNGVLISELSAEKEVYYLPYNQIPESVKNAIISIEDKKFYGHDGVDYLANLRAAIALIKNKGEVTQGASTITQQLARNIFLSHEVTIDRKIKEIFIASELEKKYTKVQILEFYINNIYFANGYYGIQAAAEGYFGCSASELSLSQIAFLCAVPNNPTLYNPLTNMENTYKRRDRILEQMYGDGKITYTEYQDAIGEKVNLQMSSKSIDNYAETYIYYCTIRKLMEYEGFQFRNKFVSNTDKEAYEESYYDLYHSIQSALYNGGYRVYTSIDLEKQELLQETLDERLSNFTEVNGEGVYTLQGAATCIDNDTGRVVAIIGGRGQELEGYTLNRAFQSYRQPGSAIKPLIVYLPAFMEGHTLEEVVVDEPFEDGPKNAGNAYSGEITLRQALEYSKNTIAWKLFDEITPQKGLSYLLQMGFQKIDDKDYVLPASLGGFTYGVSSVEMAAGYATIVNDGYYRDPTCIIKIMDSMGNEIVSDDIYESKIYDTNACRMVTDALTGVLSTGTGKGLGLNLTAAGKTGTTTSRKDGWFAGYTPYYTTSVWVGYDLPKSLSDLGGNTYPGQIWKSFMNGLHEGFENQDFPMYEVVEQAIEENDSVLNTDENTFTEEIDSSDEESDYLGHGYYEDNSLDHIGEDHNEDQGVNSDSNKESTEGQEINTGTNTGNKDNKDTSSKEDSARIEDDETSVGTD